MHAAVVHGGCDGALGMRPALNTQDVEDLGMAAAPATCQNFSTTVNANFQHNTGHVWV